MRDFYRIFYIEVKRFFSRKNMFAWLIIFLLLLFQAHMGVKKVQKFPKTIKTFKQIQNQYFNNIAKYTIYGFEGFRVLFIPSSPYIFALNSSMHPGLIAWTNVQTKIELSDNFKSKIIIPFRWFNQLDIASIIAWLITLLALWNGFRSFYSQQYMTFMSRISLNYRYFMGITIAHLFLFCCTFIFSLASVYIFISLKGILFSREEIKSLSMTLLVALIMIFIFHLIGVIMGILRKKTSIYISLVIIWILLNFGTFWTINMAIEKHFPELNWVNKTEFNKYEKIESFEKRILKDFGYPFSKENKKKLPQMVNSYFQIEFKQMQEIENQLKEKIEKNIKNYMKWCMIFPTTFFRITSNEVSSSGYLNYLAFYNYVHKKHQEFVYFWMDKCHINYPGYIVNFIQGDEDIFRGKSMLPPYFSLGLIINSSYCIILFFLSFYFFKRKMAQPFEEEIHSELFESKPAFGENESFNSQVIKTFFSRSKGLKTKIIMNDDNNANNKNSDYFYLPNPEYIPGELKGKHLLFLFKPIFQDPQQVNQKINDEIGKDALNKKFQKLDTDTKANILLTLALNVNASIYVFDSFIDDVSNDARTDLANKMHDKYIKSKKVKK